MLFKSLLLLTFFSINTLVAVDLSPGSTFYVDFPKLGKTWANKKARMGIYIPKDYTPEKSFPLLVFYGGGKGNDSPNPAKKMVGENGFICVGVPYHWQDEKIKGGWESTTWAYYNTMFTKLAQLVPNINPKNRLCSGFSSGGAAITSFIGRSPEFRQYFYAFMPGGSGWDMGGLSEIKGRPMYMFMGEKDSRVSNYDGLFKDAKAAGIDVTYLRFKGGHSMPAAHFKDMQKWIKDKVIFRDLPQLEQSISKDFKAKKYAKAYSSAKEILNIANPDMAVYQKAEKVLSLTQPYGEKLSQKLLSSKANLTHMKQFVMDWQGADFVAPIKEKCHAVAEAQLNKILGQKMVSVAYLKRFITYWDGFEINNKALEKLDALANTSLEKIMASRNNNSSKYKTLERFIKDWAPSKAVGVAQEKREELAQSELEEIKKMSASRQKSKLKSFGRYFQGSQAANEANELLKKK